MYIQNKLHGLSKPGVPPEMALHIAHTASFLILYSAVFMISNNINTYVWVSLKRKLAVQFLATFLKNDKYVLMLVTKSQFCCSTSIILRKPCYTYMCIRTRYVGIHLCIMEFKKTKILGIY